ncbi:ankyrin [Schizophyllum commune H4-8]|nr:ankyrin [Schizophyllum commune H4-8]KAI5889893.1 ankyrin [Schizophyllum commune H4-8]
MTRLLLHKGAHVEDHDVDGYTSLHTAACKGHINIVNMLLERGADVNAINTRHNTPLHLATLQGHDDIIGLLVDRGAVLEARNEDGWTPLYLAVYYRRAYRIIEVLLKLGSDPRTRADDDTTLLDALGEAESLPARLENVSGIRELLQRAGCTEKTGRFPINSFRRRAGEAKAST